jgi:hypothetical protein
MRIRVLTAWLSIVALVGASPAWAKQQIADPAVQQAAIADKANADAAARQTVTEVLQRSDVKAMAEKLGVDLKGAESAVKTMPADQVSSLAQQLLNADPDLAGGNTTVTISVTTLLLIIIIILLVAN